MASDEPGSAPSAESATPGGRHPRPPATIDLTATEIARQAAEAPPTSPGEEPMAESVSPPLAENPSVEPAHSGDVPPAAPASASHDGGATGGDTPASSASSAHDTSPPPTRRKSRGLAGALIGCAVTLVAVAGAWVAGVFEPADSAPQLAAKVAALEAQVQALASRAPAAAPAADSKAITDLGARLDAISQTLRRLDTLEARLGKLESTPAGTRPAATDPALLERIAATEKALQALKDGAADLRARIDALAEKAATPPAAAEAERHDIDALAARVAALEATGKTLDERLSKAAGRGVDTAVRLALVAMELRVAVERGLPFAVELEAAKLAIADKSVLAPLEAVAATGVRPPQALARELADVAPAMLRAAGTPPQEGGLLDRLQANAERLIRIRPLSEAAGNDPTSVIVRAEVKATRGDLAGALADIESLPAEIKAPAASWIKSVQARLAAVDAARKLAVSALEALGKPMP